MDFQLLYRRARDKRGSLFDDSLFGNNVYRLVHSEGDGLFGLTVDRYGDAFLIEQHTRDLSSKPLGDAIAETEGKDAPIFLKHRWSSQSPCEQVSGPSMEPCFSVVENGVRFNVDLRSKEHTGLFIDSRPARAAVGRLSKEKRLLNLFSYTCGFGLAAAAGGAKNTTNVDNKRSALTIGKSNYDLNNLPADSRTFLRSDVHSYLARLIKSGYQYDLVVLDPPPRFKRPGKNPFDARTGYHPLIRKVAKAVAEGGVLVAGLNAGYVSDRDLVEMIQEGVKDAGRRTLHMNRVGPGEDFPPCDSRPTARFFFCTLE